MKTFAAQTEIFADKFNGHKSIKKNILAAISGMGKNPLTRDGEKISNTDWYVPKDVKRKYWDLIEPEVKKFMLNIAKANGAKGAELVNYWFQQYEKGDYHEWHVHPVSMYSCVYYLDVPPGTETMFKLNSQEIKFPVSEGEMIAFPSCFFHCSKPNLTDKTKTVIAFNLLLSM